MRGDFRQTSKAQCVVLLENVRFHKGETKNDPVFAEQVREQDTPQLGNNGSVGLGSSCMELLRRIFERAKGDWTAGAL